MAWPVTELQLFAYLADNERTEEMLKTKTDSSNRSTNRKLVDSIVKKFASAVGEEDFDDNILLYLDENKIWETIKKGAGIVGEDYNKEHALLDTIESNLIKLVQEIQGRKGRGVVHQLFLDILSGKDVKENIILLQKAISNKNSTAMGTIRKTHLSVQSKVVELIKIIEENQDTIDAEGFLSDEKVNINQSMFRLSLSANEIEDDELVSLQKQAKAGGWKRNMKKGKLIYSKLFPSEEISSNAAAHGVIKAQFPLVDANDSYRPNLTIDNSNLRELLIQKDRTLRHMSSTEQIESKMTNDLVAEENIDEGIVESYFKLLKEGFKNTPAMKSITDFKINGTEMYNKILNNNSGSNTYMPSRYLIKVLINVSSANLFELTMKKNAQESILPETTYRAFRSQKFDWAKKHKGERNPAEKDTTNIDYKEYIKGYNEMTDKGLYSVNSIDYLNRDKDNPKVPEDKLEIINPDAKKDHQLVNVRADFKTELDELIETSIMLKPSTRRRYKAWLEENNLKDSALAKTSRYVPKYPELKTVDLSKESLLIQTLYAIVDREPLMKFLGSSSELKDMFKIFNIERGLKTYYHTINLMTATDLMPYAKKIDDAREKDEEDSLVDNPSLLTAVKSFATKLDAGLIQLKESFKEALGSKLKDIEENPTNYLAIYKSDYIKDKIIRFQLMDRRETNDSG